jgi:AraC-like DNA-binding protein
MKQPGTTLDANEFFGDVSDPGKLYALADGSEHGLVWPKQFGEGFLRMVKLRPGMLLGLGRYRLKEKICVSMPAFESRYQPVMLSYWLSGSLRFRLKSHIGKNDFQGFRQGHSALTYLPDWEGSAYPGFEVPMECVSVYIDPGMLETCMADLAGRVPHTLRDIADGAENKRIHHIAKTSSHTKGILYQILNCPYQGGLKRLYLEGKALELIAGSMAQFMPRQNESKKKFTLRPTDVERIHHAQTLIAQDFVEPPRLQEIAHAVGLSHPKLNYGFREIFGSTIFGYLRELRLNKAKALLDDGTMNVTEVAYEVGYSSLSYFAKAFKDHFGTAPGNYLRSANH